MESEDYEELIRERDNYIDEIEAELQTQEKENEKQRDENDRLGDTVADLQTLVKQLRLDNDDLTGTTSRLEEEVNAHKSRLDVQKNILAVAAKSSEEAKKIQKDGHHQLHRLEVENQRLRSTITEVEEDQDILVNEIDTLVNEHTTLKEQNEELSTKCDALYADLDEKARTNAKLLEENERAHSELEDEKAAFNKAVADLERKDKANRAEITRLLLELERERDKHRESAYVKENDAFRVELTKIRGNNKRLQKQYDVCQHDKNQAERDLDSAIQALNESKRNAKDQASAFARKERSALSDSEGKLEAINRKLDGELQRYQDAEQQLDDLRTHLEQSEARNASYEKNHGLTEAIHHQKSLEADIRRRDFDIKRLNHTLGEELDKRRELSKACDWLKEKANVGQDFEYDDQVIKSALEREDNRLRSENVELSRQIKSLEDERTKLLTQLREQAIDIGDKGIRFLGMSSDQLSQVMEFASNVRQGNCELPLNDRSKQLLSDIATLKSDRKATVVTIERLQREVFALSEGNNTQHGEGGIVQQALNDMAKENQKLRSDIDTLKANKKATQNMAGQTSSYQQESNGLDMSYEHGPRNPQNTTGDLMNAQQNTPGVDERNERLQVTLSSMETTVKELRSERDQLRQLLGGRDAGLMGMLSELSQLRIKCHPLEEALKQEQHAMALAHREIVVAREQISSLEQWKLNAIQSMERHQQISLASSTVVMPSAVDGINKGAFDEHGFGAEIKSVNDSLYETQRMLSGYIDDVSKLRGSVFTMQERRSDSEKVRMQVSCLNDLIREKDRIINLGRKKLGLAKQLNLKLSRERAPTMEIKARGGSTSMLSISTLSIDRSIRRAANSTANVSPTRARMETHLQGATQLLFEKESLIEERNQTILMLEEKLVLADEAYEEQSKENDSMKSDINTLISRLSQADAAVNGIEAYKKKCEEAQVLLDKGKNQVSSLKGKLALLSKEMAGKEEKIRELQESQLRAKRLHCVTRQGRARSEQNSKEANESISKLKGELLKKDQQINSIKKEKVEAQNEKLKLTRKARLSAAKLKDMTEDHTRKESSKTVEELEKRVNVLNNTVTGLATQNSKLRGELASLKFAKKATEEDEAAAQRMARPRTVHKERPPSSRSLSLEMKVAELKKSLSAEKKRIQTLEQALQSATRELKSESGGGSIELLQQQILTLTRENKDLKLRTAAANGSNLDTEGNKLKAENVELKKN